MTAGPPVSIGLPVYNGERYLAEAIDSLLAQTYGDFELVVSDNASTDRTQEIARDYAARDRRVRYDRAPSNIGAARNYMRAFALSSGRFFRWATCDDVSGPESLARCVAVLEGEQDVVLAYPKTRLIDATGRVIGDYDDGLDLRSPSPSERFIMLHQHLGLCNAIYGLTRPAVLRTMRPLGSFVNSDLCFMAELALRGRFWEVPHRVFFRRMHGDAYSSYGDTQREHFYNPGKTTSSRMHAWRRLWNDWRAIERSGLDAAETWRLRLCILRLVNWQRAALARELLRGVKAGLR